MNLLQTEIKLELAPEQGHSQTKCLSYSLTKIMKLFHSKGGGKIPNCYKPKLNSNW